MSIPKLQIACDHSDLAGALADIKKSRRCGGYY